MRYKRYKQMNITHIIPKNKISQELEGISAILDANPQIVQRAHEDLVCHTAQKYITFPQRLIDCPVGQ